MDAWSVTAWLAAARSVQIGSCLVLFGVWAFDRLIARPVVERDSLGAEQEWRIAAVVLTAAAAVAVLLSGLAWFAIEAVVMSGRPPGEALTGPVMRIVWSQTHFGGLCQVRLVFWLATSTAAWVALCLRRQSQFYSALRWITLTLSGLLLASLAWAGHGSLGGPAAPWHLLADVVHLLAAGCWPAGLLPLAWLFWKLRRAAAPDPWPALAELTHRFSAMALAAAVLLAATGVVNSYFLLGPVSHLLHTGYGRVLVVKIGCFAGIVCIGAANLLCLRPRLHTGTDQARRAVARRLQRNIAAELLLTALVIVLVAILGISAPGAH